MAARPVGSEYEDDKNKLKKFLQEYEEEGVRKYEPVLQEIANRSVRVLEIDVQDVESFDEDLGRKIRLNTRRYQILLSDAVEQVLPEPDTEPAERDVLDVLLEQRMQNRGDDQNEVLNIPKELKRRYEVRLMLRHEDKSNYVALRSVRANHIGQLVTIRAMVCRCSDVKPLAQVVTYSCEECGYETYQEVTARNFMPLDKCKSPVCTQYNTNAKLLMQTRGSKFSKFQELKIQELPGQVPTGHIPRVMTVHLMGELTRSAAPGDEIEVSGIFLPTPYTGYKAMKAGLTADTYLEATSVHRIKQRYEDYEFSDELQEEIMEQSQKSGTYAKLARSIAPEIWGHEDVKKALLLQLVGGCDRHLKDGLRIRGDMHVCLMGDPGVAKSQLLKHVAKLAPRGVYTTGKGSSGVGLTASVLKDPFSGELMLEGGALVLADQGICCIDEFDKMEDSDRTAIHEVLVLVLARSLLSAETPVPHMLAPLLLSWRI
jgi:DNA replication licensing factor MCM7